MDVPEPEVVTNVDNVFLYFIYGFLVLLGISIIMALGKAFYYFYKVRREHNVDSTDDTIATECHSISIGPMLSDRPSESNGPDSERLRLQLDKLRRLLNRLNAMGTFSRDTIGDLSAESAVRVDTSKAASSDLSEFWSSIDFDEFEDSTINYGKFGKTPTDKSVSPSISDFSLDTSGIPFDNRRHRNFATSSRENVLNVSSALNPRTNPSDAIIQILTILDSIMLKNKNSNPPLKNNALKIEKKYDESLNRQALPGDVNPSEMSTSAQKQNFLSPYVSINRKFYKNESQNTDTVINMPEHRTSETLNSDINVKSSVLSKPRLLKQLSQTIDSQCKVFSADPLEPKMSNITSVVNITSTSGSKSFYATKFSSSSKSLNDKISISQSVSLCVDPFACMATHAKKISKSQSAAPLDDSCKDVQSNTHVSKKSPCALDIEAISRSHSLSELLDKTLLSIESSIDKPCSPKQKAEISNLKTDIKSPILKSVSEISKDSEKYLPKNNEIETAKSKSTQHINKIFSSVSSRSLHSAAFSNSLTLKSFVSEPEIKNTQRLGMISPNISSSGSDTFLSPLVIDISASEKFDWKSPAELSSDIIVVRNLTPHNQNATISRKSCIWSTPPLPLPKEIVTDEITI